MRDSKRLYRAVRGFITETNFGGMSPKHWDKTKLVTLFSVLRHPVEAFEDIKYRKRGSVLIANVMALLYFVVSAAGNMGTGFIFNYRVPEEESFFTTLAASAGILLLWTLVSWALSTMLNGEGRFSEIWITACYSVLPVLLIKIPAVVLSHILTIEESPVLQFLDLSQYWMIVLLLFSVFAIQQFSVAKTIFFSVVSVVGMLAAVLIILLFFSLFQQLVIFVVTIFNEIIYR